MLISTMIQNINKQLEGELLSVHELCNVVDKAIDDINTRLNTCFPVLSDILITEDPTTKQKVYATEYTAIPDRYLRTVVIPGAVFKYYTNDEEGAAVAPKHEEEFLKGLFYMERDYIAHIPEQYQAPDSQGYVVGLGISHRPGEEGAFTIDGSVFQL